MSLPADFWEEFDRRLDARLDEKLDAKLDARLEPINKQLKQLIHWTERQDIVLEREVTKSIYKHLATTIMGSHVVVPTRHFPKLIVDPVSKLEITDLDGAVILTNDPTYVKIVQHMGSLDTLPKFVESGYTYQMVIIEAKQHMTKKKYQKKLLQKERIEDIIKRAKNGELSILTKFGIASFTTDVGLYIGSVDIDASVRKQIEQDAQSMPHFGWIDFSGQRFSVLNKDNHFNDDIVASNQRGGKQITKTPCTSR